MIDHYLHTMKLIAILGVVRYYTKAWQQEHPKCRRIPTCGKSFVETHGWRRHDQHGQRINKIDNDAAATVGGRTHTHTLARTHRLISDTFQCTNTVKNNLLSVKIS